MNTQTEELSRAGVSIWLDDLSRDRLDDGSLAALIAEKNVVGVTTNPTIFHQAITRGHGYDATLDRLATEGADAESAVFQITTADVTDGCDLFTAVAENSHGIDGRVSIEVDPRLAWNTAGTIAEGHRLHAQVNRPNVHIKIPATVEGLAAITEVISAGISVNVTLIFSLERYRAVINAYLDGLEHALAAGHDLAAIHSVASFFVSRVDTEIDRRLDEIGTDEAAALRSKAGLANARLAYREYQNAFSSPRFVALAAAGARPQRPLWASTGVKDPQLPDTLYVTELVAADIVNTMPAATLEAFADHGQVHGDSITGEIAAAEAQMAALAGVGVDYDDIVATLEREGLEKFVASWEQLLTDVQRELASRTN
ncbi:MULTISPECIES: transaldolase [unclassified Microbacterium]|uniref:transaldolase n=1 Tax=unclassified Microbacterium TaxID=2609290 RepID=UPI0036567001